jgi:acetyl-CoA acetyltransferase
MVITTADKARDLSSNPEIKISIRSFGQSRVDMAYMPSAPVPAAKRALDAAKIGIEDVAAIKSHNPFAVNDIIFPGRWVSM